MNFLKKQFIISVEVRDLKDHNAVPRLRAKDYIGKGNIALEFHEGNHFPLHWHNYFEIEVILDGKGTQRFNSKTYPISKNTAYILSPVDYHAIEGTTPIRTLNISFDEFYLEDGVRFFLSASDENKIINLSDDQFGRFLSAAELLRYEIETNGPSVRELLRYLLAFFKKGDSSLSPSDTGGISRAVSFLELHFREKISLSELAEISGYNPTYFSELFKKVTGESYTERLITLRINYAKGLLSGGSSVSDACFASGFGSLSNFLTAFKERCGVTPSEYRKMHK